MKAKIEKEIDTYSGILHTSTDEAQVLKIMDWCSNREKNVASTTKEIQKRKFERLQVANQPQQLDPQKVVKNISSRSISSDEQEALALGLNFARTPTGIPHRAIIAATESTCRQLKNDEAQQLRIEVSKALREAKPPKQNIEKRLRCAITNLRKDDSIVILPADKGNATVIMDKEEYRSKILGLLEDPTNRKLKRDPTTKIEKRITQSLKDAEKNGWISNKFRLQLTPQLSTPPQIYGLPKIHKAGTPLRPIVSSIGSPTYRLAKELARILAPLMGKTDTFVKNSAEFAEDIRKAHADKETTMVSFDVVSLFTKVPLKEALGCISDLLDTDETLEERTNIPPDAICQLTELCLRATYFLFEDQFFEQVDGAAMGSPLSPIVANLYMENLERAALSSAKLAPTMWRRYVDDTFVLWPHGADQLEEFHAHLNRQHPQIQFTKEEESDNQISFLDVLVKRENGRFKTAVYRKPTHTDRYTHFASHHHPQVKSGTIRCLTERARRICEDDNRKEEMSHIRDTFMRNGYPKDVISRNLRKKPRRHESTPDANEVTTKPPSLFLPYVQGLSEKIQIGCRRLGVKTVFKSSGTLRQLLTRVKTKIPESKKKGVVYRIPCQDCEAGYIGETGRSLQKRITEHKYAVKTNDRRNGIAVHCWDMGHQPDWDAAEILETEPHYQKRRVLEAIWVRKTPQTCNLDCGLILDQAWTTHTC